MLCLYLRFLWFSYSSFGSVFSFFLLSLCVCVCVWSYGKGGQEKKKEKGRREEEEEQHEELLEEESLLQSSPCKPTMVVEVCAIAMSS